MPDKFKIATAILGAIVVYDEIVCLRNKRAAAHNQKLFEESTERNASLCRQMDYLTDMLNKHQVPVTDFDIIAMNNL